LHGTAKGSPVYVAVAEIVMQNIEERALATYKRILPVWLRYVRVVQYSDKFMHGTELYSLHITILYKSITIKNEAKH